jgi:hypothetical protein
MNTRLRNLAVSSVCVSATLAVATLVQPGSGTATATPTHNAAPRHWPAHYEIRITNLTRGQVFSPAVAAVHTIFQEPLWKLGSPASSELAQVAEDAVNGPLVAKLKASNQVADVQTIKFESGAIPPGKTGVGKVRGIPGRANRLSLVGMLVTTNDAFYGLNSVKLPRHGQSVFRAVAYDAGSEANNEKCAYIPGPPCGNGGKRMTTGAEGFVHVHAGIHGIADLIPARDDWRNPVALVEVRRLRR